MTTVCKDPTARARKIESTVLQRLASDATGAALAVATGISESTLSRLKTDHLPHLAVVLAHLGFKVVPAEMECYKPEYIKLIHELAMPEMRRRAEQPQLVEDWQ